MWIKALKNLVQIDGGTLGGIGTALAGVGGIVWGGIEAGLRAAVLSPEVQQGAIDVVTTVASHGSWWAPFGAIALGTIATTLGLGRAAQPAPTK